MAGGREIHTKIRSVQNTRKVTRALEMVSASKIRRAQDAMKASRPYATMMKTIMGHMAHATPEYRHPFMVEREVKRVGYVVISTDRGLCGGLNNNLFRAIVNDMKRWQSQGVEIDLVTVGSKATAFFRRLKVNLLGSVTQLGDKPQLQQLIGALSVLFTAYREETVDRIYCCNNVFINTMTQQPTIAQLLPLAPGDDTISTEHSWDYLYEPDAASLLDEVLTRYVEVLVFQAVLENVASEHAARMVAMKAASDNATDFIDQLQLAYNKARQAAITQEISEIVGGAAAV